jgi:hypothetical protein
MMRRIFAYAAMATLALGMSYPASAQDSEYTLYVYIYSDATHQTQVGYATPYCEKLDYGMSVGAKLVWGYVTQYRVDVQGPLCIDGEIQW